MANGILIVIDRFEAFEAAVLDSAKNDGLRVFVLNLNLGQVVDLESGEKKSVFSSHTWGPVYLGRTEIKYIVDYFDISVTLALGLNAASVFGQYAPLETLNECAMPLGEFNFSSNKKSSQIHLNKVEKLNKFYKNVFFDNEVDFILATDKGSKNKHFLLDIFNTPKENKRLLSQGQDAIGIVVSKEASDLQLKGRIRELRHKFPEYNFRIIYEHQLLNFSENKVTAEVREELRNELCDISIIIFDHISRNTTGFLHFLRNDLDRVCLVNSFLLTTHASDIGKHVVTFDNHSLGNALKYVLSGVMQTKSLVHNSICAQLDRSTKLDVPPFYEDLKCLRNENDFGVFYSVKTINTRSSAQDQRICNMFLGLKKETNNIFLVSSAPRVVERRSKLLQHMVDRGHNIKFFYGENSTSPIESYKALLETARILKTVKDNGGKVGWFIRDLHFMFDHSWNIELDKSHRERSKLEFQIINQFVDVFYTPTEETNREFRAKLPPQVRSDTIWRELSPGIRKLGSAPVQPHSKFSLSFVYTGGLGKIYKMDNYFKAIKELKSDANVQFDFIVRESEKDFLFDAGINENDFNVRIMSGDFDYYQSNAKYVVGSALLENPYAASGFPVKISNYISRQIPVLCYKNAYYADFLTSQNIGMSIASDFRSVLANIEKLISDASNDTWEFSPDRFSAAYDKYSWNAKCKQVNIDLKRED